MEIIIFDDHIIDLTAIFESLPLISVYDGFNYQDDWFRTIETKWQFMCFVGKIKQPQRGKTIILQRIHYKTPEKMINKRKSWINTCKKSN